jgi:hypothetical protein
MSYLPDAARLSTTRYGRGIASLAQLSSSSLQNTSGSNWLITVSSYYPGNSTRKRPAIDYWTRLRFSTHHGRVLLFTRADKITHFVGLLIRVSLHERLYFPSEIRGGRGNYRHPCLPDIQVGLVAKNGMN